MSPTSISKPATARRPRASAVLGLAAAALAWVSSPSTGFAGLSLAGSAPGRDDTAVALSANVRPAPEKYGGARYKRYEGYVHRLRRGTTGVHIRLDRWGRRHRPFFRILVQRAQKPCHRSGRFLERIGWWDPMKELDDKAAFKLKCDRAVWWLRNGACPTDQVASLLDRAGLIRRTGPGSKMGEWEWRVPENSGPEEPEGWSYDGPHEVTWNNKPKRQMRTAARRKGEEIMRSPIIERYGFKGYAKIPIDQDILTDPVAGSALSSNFPNTELPPM